MNNTLRTPLNRLALALGLALAAMGAQAADLASATASVSNLRYRLIDLDLNDGITPSLSVTGSLVGTANTSIKITPDGVTSLGSPYVILNPDDLSASISSGTFSQTGTLELLSSLPGAKATLGPTLAASTSLSAAALNDSLIKTGSSSSYSGVGVDYTRNDNLLRNYTTTYTDFGNAIDTQQSAGVVSKLDQIPAVVDPETGAFTFPIDIPNLTLSANTLLLIEGTATTGISLDQAGLDIAARLALGQGALASPDYFNYRATTSSNVELSIYRYATDTLPGGSLASQDQGAAFTLNNSAASDSIYEGGLLAPLPANPIDSKDFSLSYANTLSNSVQATLALSLYAGTSINGYAYGNSSSTTWGDPISDVPVVVVPTPGIPEPSTYALMALGLAGIAAVARRRRNA
jgi:hypothetical protein